MPASWAASLVALPLGIVKVGRYGDDRAVKVVVKGVFSTVAQGGQNLSTDLHRRLRTRPGLQGHHPRLVDKLVGQLVAVGNVCSPRP